MFAEFVEQQKTERAAALVEGTPQKRATKEEDDLCLGYQLGFESNESFQKLLDQVPSSSFLQFTDLHNATWLLSRSSSRDPPDSLNLISQN